MIELYTGCLVLFIGNLIVGQSSDIIRIVKYDNNKKMQKQLQQVQNNCIRLVSKIPKDTSISTAYKEFKTLTVQQLIEQELLKIGHRVTHKIYPTPILNMFSKNRGEKTHEYETRNKNTPNIQ